MGKFYNPYQFIPVTGKINGEDSPTLAYKDLQQSHCRHDYWLKDHYSGRLICEIETITPTVVGNQHETVTDQNKAETKVQPYKDINGELALPANSLRGMISSITESLSQSSLRVLNQSSYSIRKEVGQGLSAIGLLMNDPDNKNQFALMPLTLPNLRLNESVPYKWQTVFEKSPQLQDCLPAYIDGYEDNRSKIQYKSNSFLDRNKPDCFFPKKNGAIKYYAKLHNLQETTIAELTALNPEIKNCLKIKTNPKQNTEFLLGQKLSDQQIITAEDYEKIESTEEKAKYTQGILHVLGIDGREEQLPRTKKHEKFIPIPRKSQNKLELPDQVVENFKALSEERKKASNNEKNDAQKLPFLPKGYKARKEAKDQNYWEPQHGELVYFDIDQTGKVSEISYTSIWRQAIEGDIYQSFERINKKINPNTLPWGNERRPPNTRGLTPAEQLFGAVAEQKVTEDTRSCNLASRLQFSDAKPAKPEPIKLLDEIPLPILASPKPPSPAMYFFGKGRYIDKKDRKLHQTQPNGRKIYLHHPKNQKNWAPSKNNKNKPAVNEPLINRAQKVSVTPIPDNERFYYHIDFNNLNWDELSLLIKSLEPDQNFHHRLGLGKPLGLGTIKNQLKGLFLIDRAQRYQTLQTQRYSKATRYGEWSADLTKLYPEEAHCPQLSTAKPDSAVLIDSSTLKTLCLLGNPAEIKADSIVSYPYAEGQSPNSDTEGFQWFVNNDHKHNTNKQVLRTATDTIPTLKTNHKTR